MTVPIQNCVPRQLCLGHSTSTIENTITQNTIKTDITINIEENHTLAIFYRNRVESYFDEFQQTAKIWGGKLVSIKDAVGHWFWFEMNAEEMWKSSCVHQCVL